MVQYPVSEALLPKLTVAEILCLPCSIDGEQTSSDKYVGSLFASEKLELVRQRHAASWLQTFDQQRADAYESDQELDQEYKTATYSINYGRD